MIEMAIFYCFIFLLAQIILLTATKAECDVIEAKIETDEGEVISLKWKKTESYLANENLPVWTTRVDSTLKLNSQVMSHIGKFTPYYDFTKSSAILVLEKWNGIYGIIDLRYYIRCLSLDELSNDQPLKNTPGREFLSKGDGNTFPEHVMPASLNEISNNFLNEFQMLIKTLIIPDVNENRRPVPDSHLEINYEEKIIQVYPELLVIIPHAEAQTRENIVATVIENLIQFNAVAMLFAKLAIHNIRIHINIAAILIEMDGVGFSTNFFYLPNEYLSGKFLLETIIRDVNGRRTRNERRRMFNDDSYDFLIYTSPLPWKERDEHPGGYSTPVFDVFTIKSSYTRPRFPHQRLGAIVDSSNILNYYALAAREIAHLMSVEDDPLDYSCNSGRRCHNIMNPYSKCPNCLTWSSISIESFKKYLSTNRNRCYLLNHPRSLRPFNTPARTLYPGDQCFCYHFLPDRDVTYLSFDRSSKICKNKIQCHLFHQGPRPLPIDGTPCDRNDRNKVCWKNDCVSIPRAVKEGSYK